jgi:protein phosphatase
MDEITAEFAPGELAATAELRFRVRSRVACKSDLGRTREHNEDKFEFFLPEAEGVLAARGQTFVVCDGMGGHAAGQIASELACKTFLDVYYSHPAASPGDAAAAAVKAANRYVLEVQSANPGRRGMGTTLSSLILVQDAAWIAHVGDSRIYRLRDGTLEQLTLDHSYVEELLRRGVMTPEDAAASPRRSWLTRAVGAEEAVQPDVVRYDLMAADRFLLCTDGLVTHVPDQQIADELASRGLSEAVWRLVAMALADGGSDNVTVVAVAVDALEPVK